ncbi:hypothetical protein N656DRAFT_775450 [Canariomyces notabilis]|uniref:Uncharacterized protein n=1 Tax=Canariomyces notabilis TaxID=2074819 RepID=A0AAN6YVR3_9PEZI|nr:hypothetical protein N656DRAFT_775450 [Canariomyces arenarius]
MVSNSLGAPGVFLGCGFLFVAVSIPGFSTSANPPSRRSTRPGNASFVQDKRLDHVGRRCGRCDDLADDAFAMLCTRASIAVPVAVTCSTVRCQDHSMVDGPVASKVLPFVGVS